MIDVNAKPMRREAKKGSNPGRIGVSDDRPLFGLEIGHFYNQSKLAETSARVSCGAERPILAAGSLLCLACPELLGLRTYLLEIGQRTFVHG